MTIKQSLMSILILIIGSLLMAYSVNADEETSFYVMPVLPQNQLPSTSEYFHLQTDQDINQQIEVMIINDSDEDKTFHLSVLDGMTTDLGDISYDTQHEYDKSQKIKLSQQIDVEELHTVKAKESGNVELQLAVAVGDFSGQLLGAINVYEQTKGNDNPTGVVNQFAYNIPIKIDVKTSQITAKLVYDGLKVTNNGTKSELTAGFINPTSTIIRDLSLTYKLSTKQDKKLIVEQHNNKLEVAPNSNFHPSILIGSKALKAGKYRIEILAVSEISGINETWQEDFTITGRESRALNEGLIVEQTGVPWYILASLMVIGIVILGYGYKRHRGKRML